MSLDKTYKKKRPQHLTAKFYLKVRKADSGDRWLTVEFHSSVVKYQRSGLEFQVKKKIPGLERRRLMAAWTAATINCH